MRMRFVGNVYRQWRFRWDNDDACQSGCRDLSCAKRCTTPARERLASPESSTAVVEEEKEADEHD